MTMKRLALVGLFVSIPDEESGDFHYYPVYLIKALVP